MSILNNSSIIQTYLINHFASAFYCNYNTILALWIVFFSDHSTNPFFDTTYGKYFYFYSENDKYKSHVLDTFILMATDGAVAKASTVTVYIIRFDFDISKFLDESFVNL